MGARELLRYLEKLEIGLSSFSYEELGIVEAGELKKSFEVFKTGLENKVFGISEMEQLNLICEEAGIKVPLDKPSDQTLDGLFISERFISLIGALEETQLSQKQKKITHELKAFALQMTHKAPRPEKEMDHVHSYGPLKSKKMESDFSAQKVNLKPVLKECLGQFELLEEFVRIYKLNILEFIGSMKVHLNVQNFKEIRVSCQKVIPSLRMMNTAELLGIIQQIDFVCKTDKDIKYLEFLYQQFLMDYPKVEALVDFEIKALRDM